jgi:hypothetical protein
MAAHFYTPEDLYSRFLLLLYMRSNYISYTLPRSFGPP